MMSLSNCKVKERSGLVRVHGPQHWMQQDHTICKWGDFKQSVPHDASNVATFNLAPGYQISNPSVLQPA